MPRNSSFIYKNKPVDVKEVAELKPPDVTVGTKVRISSPDFHRISEAVAKSLEGSLVRLRLDRVDIFHLHNAITETGNGEALSVRQVLNDVLPAFERLRQQGKTRFLGLTAIGDTAALHQVIDARVFDSAQVIYNMLNPSAAVGLPAELLKEVAPGIKRVAFIFDPKLAPGGGSYYTRLIEASAATSAVVPTVAPVHDAVEIERAIGEFAP